MTMYGYFDSLESALANIDFDGEPTPTTLEELTAYLDDQGIDYLVDVEVESLYRDSLDSISTVEIGDLIFTPSIVLEEIDPIAYRCGLADYSDSLGEYYLVLDF